MSKKWENNSRPSLDKSKAKIRICVSKISAGCLGEFYSYGPGHRMCSKCKELAGKQNSQSSHSLNIRR